MRYTQNLKLPIFDEPEFDLFNVSEFNTGNQNIENKFIEIDNGYKTTQNELNNKNSVLNADEAKRAAAETARATEEATRSTAENKRVAAETSRVAEEQKRISAETSRVAEEQKRISAETSRVAAENQRILNENERIAAEDKRGQEITDLTNKVNKVESNITILSNKFITVENSVSTLTGKVTTTENNINTINNKITTIESQINKLVERVTNLENGNITPPPQEEVYGNIVISTNTINIQEGQTTTFSVMLDKAPTNNQSVTILKNNGNINLNKSTITFTTANWNVYQTVNLEAIENNDYDNKTSIVTLSSPNVNSKNITVNITNNDIKPIPVSSIKLNAINHTLKVDETFKLIETVLPENASNKTVTWEASNNKITVVNGLVTGKLEGTASVIVKSNENPNIKAQCNFEVQALGGVADWTINNISDISGFADSWIVFQYYISKNDIVITKTDISYDNGETWNTTNLIQDSNDPTRIFGSLRSSTTERICILKATDNKGNSVISNTFKITLL